jgi:hypothetical protein
MARTGETNWPSNCLFHYRDRINAEDIAADGCSEVGTGGQFGFGQAFEFAAGGSLSAGSSP